MGIFSVVPELLLILVEFPVTIFLTWFFCCYMIYHSFLGFLFNLMFYPILFIGGVIGFLFLGARWAAGSDVLVGDYQKWIEITDDSISSYKGKKIPIREAYEWYMEEKLHFTQPLLEVFLHRNHLFQMVFTTGHLEEIIWGVLGKSAFKHDTAGDHEEVTAVYNLGNEFYYAFLADPMFYSCGVAYSSDETLEIAQKRKCGICCELLNMEDGDKVLDFGCGWGSWLLYVAENFNVTCTGMTISTEQLAYANERIKKATLKGTI